jgi:hypothetical protein
MLLVNLLMRMFVGHLLGILQRRLRLGGKFVQLHISVISLSPSCQRPIQLHAESRDKAESE